MSIIQLFTPFSSSAMRPDDCAWSNNYMLRQEMDGQRHGSAAVRPAHMSGLRAASPVGTTLVGAIN
jgi:hypothetical protein